MERKDEIEINLQGKYIRGVSVWFKQQRRTMYVQHTNFYTDERVNAWQLEERMNGWPDTRDTPRSESPAASPRVLWGEMKVFIVAILVLLLFQ